MAIYLDIIWGLNLLFDTLLLYLTAIVLKRDVALWRLLFGGLIGSLLILLAITPFHAWAGNPFVKMFFSVMMVLAAFGYKRMSFFFKGLMMLYLTTFLTGGILIGVHYFVQFDFQLSSSVMLGSVKGFGDPISWLFVLLGFPIAWHFSRRNIENVEMAKIQYDSLIGVCVEINEARYHFKGLVDSGNGLYDPISKAPVMIISIKNCAEEFPAELVKIAENPEEIIMGNETLLPEWEQRMRVIPYKVVGSDHQLIIALKPDRLFLEKEDGVLTVDKALISFTMQQLSSDDAFQCIVHPKMLTGMLKPKTDMKAG